MGERFIWITHISDVWELKVKKHSTGTGADAAFSTDSLGWYVRVGHGENSIALRISDEKPMIVKGQKVRFIMEVE